MADGGVRQEGVYTRQEGVYTRWNGCVLVRGLVGQDQSYFMWFRWITKLDLEPLACCSSSCSSQARSSALAPTPAAACKDRTSPEMTQRPPPPTTATHHPPPGWWRGSGELDLMNVSRFWLLGAHSVVFNEVPRLWEVQVLTTL